MTCFAGLRRYGCAPGLALLALFWFGPECTAQTGLKVEIVPITQHSMVGTVAFSPDGARVLSGGFDNSMKLWDVATGRLLRTFTGHTNVVRSVAFSPDGTKALSGSQDNSLWLWDVATGQVMRTFKGHIGTINSAAFSRDGSRIVSGSRSFRGDDNRIRIWDTATGQLLRTIAGHTGEVNSVRFSPDGSKVLAGSGSDPWTRGDRAAIRLWDPATGQLLRTIVGQKEDIKSVAYSPDGSRMLSASWDKTVKLWDSNSGQLLRSFTGHAQRVEQAEFSPDGNTIASGSIDYTIKLWDARSGRLLRTLQGHTAAVHSVAFSPDGTQVISGSDDNTLKLWNAATGQLIRTFGGQSASVNAVAISPDGARIVSGSADPDNTVKIWDLISGRLLDVFPGHPAGIEAVAFSRDGTEVLSGGASGAVRIWNATGGNLLRSFDPSTAGAQFAFSPDSKRIINGSYDGTVSLTDAVTGKPLRVMRHVQKLPAWCAPNCQKSIQAVAFSSDGSRMVSAGAEQSTKLWNTETGQLVRTINLKWGWSNSVRFSADGATLLTGDLDGGTRLLNSANGELIRLFDGNSPITSAVFSPDGSKVLAGSWDGMLKLWETASGRLIRTLQGHAGWIKSAAFTPDGSRIVSASNDTTIRIWETESGRLLATLLATQAGEWLIITPEGFFNASSKGGELLTIVRGLEGFTVDQFYQSLYRPDLVREKLAGDPRGLVRFAAASLDLTKAADSGNAPVMRVVSPADGALAASSQITTTVELTGRDGGVGRVEWRVNGVTIGIETPAIALAAGQAFSMSRSLALDAGNNTIEVVAYNRANLIASVPARITVASATTAAKDSRLFVLAAGLDNYADRRFQLAFSVADAKLMGKALTDSGNGLYQSVEVKVMSDADVVADKLDAAFAELAGKIRPNDVFVLYLAGHGKTVDGRYYFIPQNFRLDGDLAGPLVNAAVKAQGVSQEQWQRWFALIAARRSLILFDTCESGTLASDPGETKLLERGAANDRLARATGRSIITASSGSTEAFEGYRGHGLFTYNLLDALDRGDGDGNGTIEVTELAAYVYAQVIAISERVFKQRQEPQMKINLNYPLTRQARVLDDNAPAIAMEAAPTYQITQSAQLQIRPDNGATVVRSLSPKTAVTVVRSEGGWSLVASGGKPLGYVATRDLAPLR